MSDLGRCVALDMDGRRCRSKAVVMTRYHGDPESHSSLDPEAVGWVAAPFCDKHAVKWRSLQEFIRSERKRRAGAEASRTQGERG